MCTRPARPPRTSAERGPRPSADRRVAARAGRTAATIAAGREPGGRGATRDGDGMERTAIEQAAMGQPPMERRMTTPPDERARLRAGPGAGRERLRPGGKIFRGVLDGRPYPEHGLSTRDWARIPPRQVRLDELITTKRELLLDRLFAEDSTFYGDLFCHVVEWRGERYLEDGLHRAVHAALLQRSSVHARVLQMPD
jgi:Arc/MetJ family transcription regulator